MKEWIIKVNDFIVYLPFALLACASALVITGGNILGGIGLFIAGFVILSLLTGLYVCLSQTACEAKKQTAILEKLLKEQMKSPLDRL